MGKTVGAAVEALERRDAEVATQVQRRGPRQHLVVLASLDLESSRGTLPDKDESPEAGLR